MRGMEKISEKKKPSKVTKGMTSAGLGNLVQPDLAHYLEKLLFILYLNDVFEVCFYMQAKDLTL